MAKGFRDLVAWQRADRLASLVYRSCKDIPANHPWLVDQILRCAISVPANIAEGHGRGSRADFARFLDIARGSLSELEYFLHFSKAEGILAPDAVEVLETSRNDTGKVLFGLWRSVRAMDNSDWDHTGNKIREDSDLYVAS